MIIPCINGRLLYSKKVDEEGYADASDFLDIVGQMQIKVKDAEFFNEATRTVDGVDTVQVSAYMLSSKRQAALVLHIAGNIYIIPIEQYKIMNPDAEQTAPGIRVRIPASNDLVSMEFSLETAPWEEADPAYGFPAPSDVDTLVIETHVPPEAGRLAKAMQRHADYYLNMLMILDTVDDRDRLYLEVGQIRLAVHRAISEEVGSVFNTEFLRNKLEAVGGDYVQMTLTELLQRTTILPEERPRYTEAFELIEGGFAEYGVLVANLKKMLESKTKK